MCRTVLANFLAAVVFWPGTGFQGYQIFYRHEKQGIRAAASIFSRVRVTEILSEKKSAMRARIFEAERARRRQRRDHRSVLGREWGGGGVQG